MRKERGYKMKRAILLIASAVPAECSSAAGRVECWEGGGVVIYTDQEHVTEWGDYIIVRRK